MKMKEKLLKIQKNVYVRYTILYAVFFIAVFLPFWYNGKSFVWSMDGLSQHYSNLLYLREWVKEILKNLMENHSLVIPMWDLELGMGFDVSSALAFRPLQWLAVFFNANTMEYFFIVRTWISLYIAGIGFLLFSKHEKVTDIAALIATLMYVYSGFAIYFAAKHPLFMELVMYLPFILYGTAKILDEKKSVVFVASIALSGISYFYFLYMFTIAAFLFALVRYLLKTEKSWKDFGQTLLRFIVQYMLGLGIAAISFIPALQYIQSSDRGSAERGESLWLYGKDYYLTFLTSFSDIVELHQYGFIGMSAIGILALYWLFRKKDKQAKEILIQMGIYLICFLVPFFSWVFNGFGSSTERWSFLFSFWFAMGTAVAVTEIIKENYGVRSIVNLFGGAYIILYMIVKKILGSEIQSGICFFAIFILCYNLLYSQRKNIKNIRKVAIIMLVVLMCLETTLKSFELYVTGSGNEYISTFVDSQKVWAEKNNTSAEALSLISDNDVYRVDVVVPDSEKYKYRNYGVGLGINGLSSYYSYIPANLKNTLLDVGNTQNYQPFMIYDLSQRTVLDTLSAVKYATNSEDNPLDVPYGYTKIGTMEKTYTDGKTREIYVYQNDYALPLMYAYDSYISTDTYESLESNEKEQAMLQGIILSESNLPEQPLKFNYRTILNKEAVERQIEQAAESNENVELQDGKIIVKKDGTTVKLTIPDNVTGELYVKINGIEYTAKTDSYTRDEDQQLSVYEKHVQERNLRQKGEVESASLAFTMGDNYTRNSLLSPSNQYYYGKRNMLANLGYCTTQETLYIRFSTAGEYSYEDIAVISQPMTQYAAQVSKLQETPVTDLSVQGNCITGNINTDSAKAVCTAVPYSEGWSAYVDGQETEIKLANGMYMAVEVTPGNHQIMYVYHTPGIYAGIAISLLAIGILLLLIGIPTWWQTICRIRKQY